MKNPLWMRFARYLYREKKPTDPVQLIRHDRLLIYGFSAVLLFVFGLFTFYFVQDANTWYHLTPQVVIDKSEWKVLTDPAQREVLSQSTLWSSAKSLTDPDNVQVLKSGDLKKVWLKVVIPEEKVKLASENKAYYFRLGFLVGDFNVWVNDNQLVSVPTTSTGNIDLALPIYKVNEGKELSVIIALNPREGARNIAPLTLGVESGLVNYKTGAAFMKFNHFINRSRPMALFFVYSVFSLLFFSLWRTNRVQREYLHLAAYSIVCSLPDLLFSDSFTTGRLKDAPAHTIYLIIVMLQAAAGLSLGLSFARSNSKVIARAIWSFLIIGVGYVLAAPTSSLSALRQPMNLVVMPLIFFVGACTCLLQALWLKRGGLTGEYQPKRVTRLFSFSGVLSALSVYYFLQFNGNFDYITKQLITGFPSLVLVLFLGLLALLDYYQQNKLVKRIPISTYHRRAQLPTKLTGAVVMVDLKNSETYFSLASQLDGNEGIVPTALSHIWTAVNESGGTILRAEGDEVVAFFENVVGENPVQNALMAMDGVAAHLKDYNDELRSRYVELAEQQLHFRAAIAIGDIKPIWVEGLSGRLPGWNQVGDSMAFVEAARLLDIEKQVDPAISASRVLVQSSVNNVFQIIEESLVSRFSILQKRFVGKHDRIYLVNVYQAAPLLAVSPASNVAAN